MKIKQNYPYQAMIQRPFFEASQRLLMRWHSSPMSLKSLPIKGAEDQEKINKTLMFYCVNTLPKSNSTKYLGF